jgi:hypothetical protein
MRTTCFVTDRATAVACVTTQLERADFNMLNKIAELTHTTKAEIIRNLILEFIRRPRDPVQDDRAQWPT